MYLRGDRGGLACFLVIVVYNGDNNGILFKEGTHYRLGTSDYITDKYTLSIHLGLGSYDTLVVHLVEDSYIWPLIRK